MNTLDIIFCALIGLSVLYSFIRGLVREIFSFLAVILAFLGASYGYETLSLWLGRWMDNPTASRIVSYLALLIAISVVVSIIGRILSGAIKKAHLGWADRTGGAAFGFLKAILLIAIVVLVLTSFLPPKSKLLTESQISPSAVAIARGLSFLAPANLRTLYNEKEKDLRRIWAVRELTGEKPDPKPGGKRE
jgi:membrane protein required for colicin V production